MKERPRIVKTNDIAAYQLSVDALEKWAEEAEQENKALYEYNERTNNTNDRLQKKMEELDRAGNKYLSAWEDCQKKVEELRELLKRCYIEVKGAYDASGEPVGYWEEELEELVYASTKPIEYASIVLNQ